MELPDAERTQTLREVADGFVKARLLTTNELAGRANIEVSHEALIREWERLKGWLNDARDDVILQQDVNGDAAMWIEQGRRPDDDRLYRGTLLEDTLAWAARNNPSKDEHDFLVASQQQERRLAEKERRRQQLLWLAASTVILVIIIALVAVVYVRSMENERLQLEVNAFEARQARVATWAAGEIGLRPFGEDQSEEEIINAATHIAVLGDWTPVSRQDNYGVEMVQVPAGCFWMGSVSVYEDERPVHEVCFEEPFWIDCHEVTNAAYEAFIKAGGYEEEVYWTSEGWAWKQAYYMIGPNNGYGYNSPNQPRVAISWYEANAYCEWRDAQLPTEAQWEYAARGPDSQIYPWGNKYDAENVVNSDNANAPAEVGSRPGGISWIGAHDMAGNVCEWVADWYDGNYYDQFEGVVVIDPQGPQTETDFRVLRGGSFESFDISVRTAFRNLSGPAGAVGDLGFRCARSD